MKFLTLVWFCLLGLVAVKPAKGQHYRGMSVVSDKVVWLSGNKGFVLRTIDGGKSWDTLNPLKYAMKDFRDIYAWNSKEAIVMSSGDSTVFLKTSDGGHSWHTVYVNNDSGVFFDAFDFKGGMGIAISDPYRRTLFFDPKSNLQNSGSAFLILVSENKGEYWQPLSYFVFPEDNTESMFAASGSIIKWADTSQEKRKALFVTGGNNPQFRSSEGVTKISVPLQKGKAGGIYSFYGDANGNFCAVGGNYSLPDKRDSTAAWSGDFGKTWHLSHSMPYGYRSCVSAHINAKIWACTGTNGIDISHNCGKDWKTLEHSNFNVCAFGKKYFWLAGNEGTWKKIPIRKLK